MTDDAYKATDPDWEWLGPEPDEEAPDPEKEEGALVYLELEREVVAALESIANITGRSLDETIRTAVGQFIENEKAELEQENQK